MKKRTKAQLENAIRTARLELNDIEDKERAKKHTALIGKCYKYRNCYSCPEGESDYWYVYKKYIRIDDGMIVSLSFEEDRDGKISVYQEKEYTEHSGWVEIELNEFCGAWLKLQSSIAKYQSMII